MARRKNLPEAVRIKSRLSERLREVRVELFGDRGGSEMARQLNLPVRTWYNYESGVTVPAEVLLRFVELTSVEPMWLLHGRGPKYRKQLPLETGGGIGSVRELLRTALHRLEEHARSRPSPSIIGDGLPLPQAGSDGDGEAESDGSVLIHVEGPDYERLTDQSGPRYLAARREWLTASRDCRCLRIDDDAMSPIIESGAFVAFADSPEPEEELVNTLVVAWVQGQPLVRWFELSGRFGLLRAENPEHEPGTILLDPETPDQDRIIRRVHWISTPR